MWNGKKKAVTFSFDDGVTQDVRAIEMMNKYGLKGTFNLNSAHLGLHYDERDMNDRKVNVDRVFPSQVKELYKGHEVAVHTLTHPNLTQQSEETIVYQVETDRKILSELCGYEVVGMAYPCGGVNNDERVAEVLRNRTGIKYARTITSTFSFDKQENLLQFNPTVHFIEDELDEIVDKFLATGSDERQLLYIWGHTYALDAEFITWEHFEAVCKKLSGRADIFYGTNREVLLEND